MKKFLVIFMTVVMITMVASAASANTARSYTDLDDCIEHIGATEIYHKRIDLNKIIQNVGYFAAYTYVRGLFGLADEEDAMILELDNGLAAVVYPIEDHEKLNMDKEILRIVLVIWED